MIRRGEFVVAFGEIRGIMACEIKRCRIESNQRVRLILGQKNEEGKELL